MLDISESAGWVLITALIAGGGGGLVAGLILLDRTESPALPPGTKPAVVILIRTLVGAVAAAAFLFFFPVQQKTVVSAHGTATTMTTYSFLTVVALSLIIGTGGSAFLVAMRGRVNSMITATKAQEATTTVKEVAKSALNSAPIIAASLAQQHAKQLVQKTSEVVGPRFEQLAAELPPRLGILSATDVAPITAAIMNVTGSAPTVADPQASSAALDAQLSPMADELSSDVHDAVQMQVNLALEQLDRIVP